MAYYGNFSPGSYSTQMYPGDLGGYRPQALTPGLAEPYPMARNPDGTIQPQVAPGVNPDGSVQGPPPAAPQPPQPPAMRPPISVNYLEPWMYGVGTPPSSFGTAPEPVPSPVVQPGTQPEPVPPQPVAAPPQTQVAAQPVPPPMPQPMGYLGMANMAATGAAPQPMGYEPMGYGNYGGIAQGGYGASPQTGYGSRPMNPGMWNF